MPWSIGSGRLTVMPRFSRRRAKKSSCRSASSTTSRGTGRPPDSLPVLPGGKYGESAGSKPMAAAPRAVPTTTSRSGSHSFHEFTKHMRQDFQLTAGKLDSLLFGFGRIVFPDASLNRSRQEYFCAGWDVMEATNAFAKVDLRRHLVVFFGSIPIGGTHRVQNCTKGETGADHSLTVVARKQSTEPRVSKRLKNSG